MKLRLSSQTLAQHYIKGEEELKSYLHKHSHNTTLKPEGEEEHETQVI